MQQHELIQLESQPPQQKRNSTRAERTCQLSFFTIYIKILLTLLIRGPLQGHAHLPFRAMLRQGMVAIDASPNGVQPLVECIVVIWNPGAQSTSELLHAWRGTHLHHETVSGRYSDCLPRIESADEA